MKGKKKFFLVLRASVGDAFSLNTESHSLGKWLFNNILKVRHVLELKSHNHTQKTNMIM